MTSAYSTDLKLELMVTGENAGTWGENTNNNLNLIQQAIAGFESIALSDGGTVTLAMTDKAISTARNMVIKFTGTLTGASTVTIPDTIEKFYIFDCSAVSGPTNLTIKTVSGTGFTLDAAKIYAAYTDGTNLNEISLDTLGGTLAFADITGTVATAQIADDAVTTAKIADANVTTAKILDANVTTAKILDANVTTAKIADDAVTADKLANTAVTAAEYTLATVTVDAQGRITAASSGSAGGGSFVLTDIYRGDSGTFTANPATTKIHAFGLGGGGGSGNIQARPNISPGGQGGFGFAEIAVTQPYAVPVRAGSAGSNADGVNGSAGQSSFITSDFTANGGGGGMYPGTGSQGSASVGPAGTLFFNETGSSKGSALFRADSANASQGGAGTKTAGGSGGTGLLIIYENIGS
jgi:hypothetical protein